MKERRSRDTDPRMRLDTRGEGRTCLERERMRKQKTERLRREKAERWGSNLRARQTLLNTAAFREICQFSKFSIHKKLSRAMKCFWEKV